MPELNANNFLGMLERYLELTSTRQSLVITNMANVDTPNYRTKDIDFRSELHRVVDGTAGPSEPTIRSVSGLLERPDGNNVSMDREGMMLAETQMQYRIGVQVIRSEFHRWMTAMKDGSS